MFFVELTHPSSHFVVETFIELLKDIDSPNEITEYVNTYLGQSKLSRDFSKNFILKRSYLRNKGKNSADQLEVL